MTSLESDTDPSRVNCDSNTISSVEASCAGVTGVTSCVPCRSLNASTTWAQPVRPATVVRAISAAAPLAAPRARRTVMGHPFSEDAGGGGTCPAERLRHPSRYRPGSPFLTAVVRDCADLAHRSRGLLPRLRDGDGEGVCHRGGRPVVNLSCDRSGGELAFGASAGEIVRHGCDNGRGGGGCRFGIVDRSRRRPAADENDGCRRHSSCAQHALHVSAPHLSPSASAVAVILWGRGRTSGARAVAGFDDGPHGLGADLIALTVDPFVERECDAEPVEVVDGLLQPGHDVDVVVAEQRSGIDGLATLQRSPQFDCRASGETVERPQHVATEVRRVDDRQRYGVLGHGHPSITPCDAPRQRQRRSGCCHGSIGGAGRSSSCSRWLACSSSSCFSRCSSPPTSSLCLGTVSSGVGSSPSRSARRSARAVRGFHRPGLRGSARHRSRCWRLVYWTS